LGADQLKSVIQFYAKKTSVRGWYSSITTLLSLFSPSDFPHAWLRQPKECWSDAWQIVGPNLKRVMNSVVSKLFEVDQAFPLSKKRVSASFGGRAICKSALQFELIVGADLASIHSNLMFGQYDLSIVEPTEHAWTLRSIPGPTKVSSACLPSQQLGVSCFKALRNFRYKRLSSLSHPTLQLLGSPAVILIVGAHYSYRKNTLERTYTHHLLFASTLEFRLSTATALDEPSSEADSSLLL
jgi:hypothetical protein